MERRNFLKLFGAGTAIVPVVSGLPLLAAEARLIEEPKIELFDKIPDSFGDANVRSNIFNLEGKYGITVIFEHESGKRLVMQGETFVLETKYEMKNFYSERYQYPIKGVAHNDRVEWTLKGQMVPNDENEIAVMITEGCNLRWLTERPK